MTVTPGGGDTAVGRMLAQAWDAGDSLRTSPVWWVSRDMTTLATDTAQAGDLPDMDPPSDKGFIVFQDGDTLPSPGLLPRRAHLHGGRSQVNLIRSTGDTSGKPWRIGTEVFTREQAFIDGCDPRLPLAYVPLPEGVRLDLLADILTAVWALSEQSSISKSRPPRVTPLDRVPARYEREKIPRVKMLILRENLHRPGGKIEPDEKGREYTHRWIVRGFWREQPYGKDHAKRRRQWIPPLREGACGQATRQEGDRAHMVSMSMDELISLHVAGLASTSRKAHRSHLADWVRWCNESSIDPWKVGPEHIELYGRWLRETMGYAVNTQYSAMGMVSRLYTDAYHCGLIDRDPAPFVRRPRRRSHSEGTWLDRGQARTLLDAAEKNPDPRLGALICLLLLNGLRISEVLSLDVEDYKPGNPPILHLHRKGGWEQNVAISTRTTCALDRLIGGRRSGPVLLDKEGNRLTHRRMMVLFDELTAPLGLNRITPHGLRCTFATLSREAGVPDEDIMAAGGWAHKQMLDYYDMTHHALKGKATNTLTDYLG